MIPQINTYFYYPTTVVLIDDNEGFLTDLKMSLSQDFPYLTFSKPQVAIKYLEKHTGDNSDSLSLLLPEDVDSQYNNLVPSVVETRINISKLHQLIYNRNRFNEISVVVVDYEMPGISGGDLCYKLKDIPAKKLMLTGIADKEIAVDLFNRGIIDKFLVKNSQHLDVDVNNAITELQEKYFIAKSEPLVQNLNAQSDCLLKSLEFYKILKDICKRHHIVEYYLVDPIGSFLLLQRNGTPLWFIVETQEMKNERIDFAKHHDASDSILNQMKNSKNMTYFANIDQLFSAEGNEWAGFIYEATQMTVGQTKFYYSLVTDDRLELNKEELYTYEYYTQNDWPPVRT